MRSARCNAKFREDDFAGLPKPPSALTPAWKGGGLVSEESGQLVSFEDGQILDAIVGLKLESFLWWRDPANLASVNVRLLKRLKQLRNVFRRHRRQERAGTDQAQRVQSQSLTDGLAFRQDRHALVMHNQSHIRTSGDFE